MTQEASRKRAVLEPSPISLWLRLGAMVARFKLRRCTSVGQAPRVIGRVMIHGGGRIRVGQRVTFAARSCPVELHALPGAEILIGDDVVIEAGVSIEAQERVTIGDRCVIGRFCKILDNHFHPLRGNRHDRPPSEPVVLEADVDLGPLSVILPGAVVATGLAVGAGKVISRRAGARSPAAPSERSQ